MSSSSPTILPIVTIQHDFVSIISDVREGRVPDDTFWLSCYKMDEPSVHGKVHASLDELDRDVVVLEGKEGVDIKQRGRNEYTAACSRLSIPQTSLAVPRRTYPDSRKASKITAFDVAPDGSQFATGHHDGTVHISSTSQSTSSPPPASSKAHLSTVTSLRFFPSSRVLLTAGNDFSLTILSAEPLQQDTTPSSVSPVRTLRGHTRAVTSTSIISRGRNVLSGAKDGTIRLWDVSTGAQIRAIGAGKGRYTPVLSLDAGERRPNQAYLDTDSDAAASANIDPREVETADKIVFCGLQDGTFEMIDLRSKRSAFQSNQSVADARSMLNAVAYDAKNGLVATGTADGVVQVYDTRSLEKPLSTFRRNRASVEDLAFVPLSPGSFWWSPQYPSSIDETPGAGQVVGLAIATEDGLPYVANVYPSGPSVLAELVGGNCDGIGAVKFACDALWTAADDGSVRHYAASGSA